MPTTAVRQRRTRRTTKAAQRRVTLAQAAVTEAVPVLLRLFQRAPAARIRAVVADASLVTIADALSAAAAAAPDPDPLAGALARGAARRETLLAEAGGTLTPQGVAAQTGMSRQTVNNWRRKGQIIALPRGRRDFVFPACQFLDDRPLPGLDQLLATSALRDPLGQLEVLLAPSHRMGGLSPLELLHQGRIEDAIAVARDTGSPLDEDAPALAKTAPARRTARA
jgi:hypothetical protein